MASNGAQLDASGEDTREQLKEALALTEQALSLIDRCAGAELIGARLSGVVEELRSKLD